MEVGFRHFTSLTALMVAGCGGTPVSPPIAQGPGCIIEPELLQRCDPPALPTVQTFEQIDAAVTEAYVCTNQLNAQLTEILRRCSEPSAPGAAHQAIARQAALVPADHSTP